MRRPVRSRLHLLRALPRIALLAAVLFSPLIAMQSVQAGTTARVIESSQRPATGIGLVILTGILRS